MPSHQLHSEKTQRNKETALAVFMAKKAEIDEMLARLTSLSDEHFNLEPDEINWSHVGTLGHYHGKLREIADMAFREGEYAE